MIIKDEMFYHNNEYNVWFYIMIGYIHMNKSVHVMTTDADRFVSTGLNSWYI